MKESKIERLIALDDYIKAIGLEDGISKLNILDVIGIQRKVENIIQESLSELNDIYRFDQEDFDKRDIGL